MIIEHLDTITLVQGDCLEFMRGEPDLSYDLAIVDPPYGIDAGNYKDMGKIWGNCQAKRKEYHVGDWDKLPPHKPILLSCNVLAKTKLFGVATISLISYNLQVA